MKTKTKKAGIFTAMAAVLIMAALLVTNCVEPLDSSKALETQQIRNIPQPQAGYGNLILNLSENSARTILPVLPTAANYEIAIYEASTPSVNVLDDTQGLETTVAATALAAKNYEIPVGSYRVVVTALNATGAAFATGETENNVTVSDGVNTPAPVTLAQIVDGFGTGTFAWDFNGGALPDNADSATISIYNLVTPGYVTGYNSLDISLNLDNTVGVSIASGYYRVSVIFAPEAGENYFDKTVMDYVHIYQGMTSTFTVATISDLSPSVHTITYTHNGTGNGWSGGTTATAPTLADRTINHGSLIIQPDDPDLPPTNGYTFDGWYYTVGLTDGTDWDFSSFKVLSSRTLYGKWLAPSLTSLSITLAPWSLTTELATANITAGTTLSADDITFGFNESLTIVAAINDANAVITGWYFGSTQLTDGNDGVAITTSTTPALNNDTLTITFDEVAGALLSITTEGTNYITVTGTSGDAGSEVYWAAKVEVIITN